MKKSTFRLGVAAAVTTFLLGTVISAQAGRRNDRGASVSGTNGKPTVIVTPNGKIVSPGP
ncbi:hypothetical protein [Haloferula sargassicola]|uniref:hypothetical protein n=1 Tax=Haloferula sargassicola TaxID=490096 RepID=UPI0033656C6F